MVTRCTFTCPSCGTKLAPIEVGDHATVVARRRCRNRECRERWQLVTARVAGAGPADVVLHKAEFTFLGR